MDDSRDVDLNYALKYLVDFKDVPDHFYFEHAYSQPSHKKYHTGFVIPAKYLFTVPVSNSSAGTQCYNDTIDVETVDHSPPLFYNSSKLNNKVVDEETEVYDDNWMDKIDFKNWNIIKHRLFKTAIQILEAAYLSRLASKGLRDEAVKRHLMNKKSATRFKFLFGSVAWDAPTIQWLHVLLMEKLPSSYIKVYIDMFQNLESRVPSHLLEHVAISPNSLSVRARIFGTESQTNTNTNKKHWDIFSTALSQHKPRQVVGNPLLVLLPMNIGNGLTPNTRPHRLMTELSMLGTLITITLPRTSSNIEMPALADQMISVTISKIIELQSDYPGRAIILFGMGASSLLAYHIALGFSQKITAVVCLGFSMFTTEGKIGNVNDKLLKLKTPTLFIIGQNATTTTVNDMEDFRSRLHCKVGLVVVGGADDHLRVNHFLKMKCSVTQSVVDRCILNEISEFLNDIIQIPKVLSIFPKNDAILSNTSSKALSNVATVDAQFLKQILSENSQLPIVKKTLKTVMQKLGQLQSDHEYGAPVRSGDTDSRIRIITKNYEPDSNLSQSPTKENVLERDSKKKLIPLDEIVALKKMVSLNMDKLNDSSNYRIVIKSDETENQNESLQYQVTSLNTLVKKQSPESHAPIQTTAPVNFTRKTRGGRRPYVRRTIPPKRNLGKTVVISSYSSVRPEESNSKIGESEILNSTNQSDMPCIENLTPDSLLDLPVIFADENEDENVINDVSLTSYTPT